MALLTVYGECATDGAATTIFNDIANRTRACGSTNQTPVNFFITCFQCFDNPYRAVMRWAFFVAGNQKADGAFEFCARFNNFLAGDHHRCDAAFHVGTATTI